MATNRKEIAPGKEKKAISPSTTATTKLRATPNTKTSVSTAPQKQIPGYLRPTSRTPTADISKQPGNKPAHKPANAGTKSIDKRLSPPRKNHVSTNASPRPPSLSGRTMQPQKPRLLGKNLTTPTKDAGKQRSLHATPASNVKKSSTGIKKNAVESGSDPAAREQITCVPHEKVENPSVPEPETQARDQESYIAEAEEKAVRVDERGKDGLMPETEAEIVHTDAKSPTSLFSTVLEHEDTNAPLDIKIRQDSEDKSSVEETSSKQQVLEGHSTNESDSCDRGENLAAGNSNEEATQEEVKEVEEAAKEEETPWSKTDEADSGSVAPDSKKTEGQEVIQEKKQEPENAAPKQQERAHGKKESAVSNDVIEETASKLREQRKNKVRALAGAFETVISLQETK